MYDLSHIPKTISDLGPSLWFSNRINWIISEVQGKNFFFDDLFSIGQGPSNVGKLNWNLLGFSSFIFSLGQCVNEAV